MIQNETSFIAIQLLKQIETNNEVSIIWLMSAVNRLLINESEIKLIEFSQILKDEFPEKFAIFKKSRTEKGLKIIE
jgi:hypothetical protein